jgi:hypothetical protein
MQTRAGRWKQSPAAWTLVGVLVMPAMARAQGRVAGPMPLFPNLGIHRQRVDCAHENPVYRVYRHEYYGYYPTCWRRFPPGWGCPSPEAPNWPAELIRAPLDESVAPPAEAPVVPPGGRDGQRPGEAPAADLPPLPRDERSPFNQDLGPSAEPPPLDLDRRGASPPPADRPALPAPSDRDLPAPDRAPSPPATLPEPDRPDGLPDIPGAAAEDRTAPPLAVPGADTAPPAPPPEPIGPQLVPAASPPLSMTTPRPPRRGFILGWLTGRNRTRR